MARRPRVRHSLTLPLAAALLPAAVLLPAAAPATAATAAAPSASSEEDTTVIGGERLGVPGPQVSLGPGAPELPEDISSRAWIVADAETGEVLAAHNAHRRLAPASTLKMLFADTLIPKFDADEVYTAEPEHFVGMGAGSSAVGIADHQTYTVEDLWHGVFLASGNDAVHALTAMNGGMEATVAELNERAADLQALDTHVVSPDGYDAEGQTSSAYDLTLIARDGLKNEDFRRYAATVRTEFPGGAPEEDEDGKPGEREPYQVQSTNRLLVGDRGLEPYEGVAGVKNGYTTNAGHTFTGVAERGDRVLLVTCMNPSEGDSLQVYRETAALFDWGFEAADHIEPVGELVPPLSEIEAAAREASVSEDDGKGVTPVDGATAAGTGARPASVGTVLGVTGGALVLMAVAAYVFHRRHPLPAALQQLPERLRRSAPPR